MRKILNKLKYFILYSPAAILCFIFFRLFNRLFISGYNDFKKHKSALICANHLSALDSFAIGHIFFPKEVFFPAKEELFRNPFIGAVLSLLNAFPVSRGYADIGLLQKISDNAKNNLVLIHPEGTRQGIEKLGTGKRAIGKIIYLSQPCVIPIYVRGTQNILKKGSYIPGLFRKIFINIGQPIVFDDLYTLDDNKETAKMITKRVMDCLQNLKSETEELINPN